MKIKRIIDLQCPHSDINCKHTFYPRISNLTSIVFNEDEINILNKGIHYNFRPNNTHQVLQEIICAETAVKAISDPKLQSKARFLINNIFNNTIDRHTLDIYTCLLYTSTHCTTPRCICWDKQPGNNSNIQYPTERYTVRTESDTCV